MSDSTSVLNDKNLLLIFATSPTGLGHIRVTDALYHGLPASVSPLLLGAQDRSIDAAYRFVSIHPITRALYEFLQQEPWDKGVTVIGKWLLRQHTKLLFQQVTTILGERVTIPNKILFVATHTSLAHQLGEIKEKLEKKTNAKILLMVQVTDDSPQPFWYTPEADLTSVPSEYTREKLYAYAKQVHLRRIPIIVNAYPISPILTETLPLAGYTERKKQTEPDGSIAHVSTPVSGAAVGMTYMTQIIKSLHRVNKRFYFHVTSKEAPYTEIFIEHMKRLPYVSIATSGHDRTTVNNYELVYEQTIIGFEITKPSEQTFKVLCTPQQRGGVIMLFTKPVGRQEYDNLHFLRTHNLIPTKIEQTALWDYAKKHQKNIVPLFRKVAEKWRGVCLPDDPQEAAQFINWCLEEKLFATMMKYELKSLSREMQSNGVEQFWKAAAALLRTRG